MMRRTWDPQTDRYWGPFTYNSAGSYKSVGLVLESAGDGEDGDAYGGSPCAKLQVSLGRRTLILALPGWALRPYREKVKATYWGKEQIARMGRDWYWQVDRCRYGFDVSGSGANERLDFLRVYTGRSTGDSRTDRCWSKFLPWATDRHVRHSYYDAQGRHAYTEPQPTPKWKTSEREAMDAAVRGVPCRYYAFRDFDGEQLYARARIEEREWRRGEGWFRWLSWFCKPLVIRRLNLDFSGETGERKGSWKGGTLGTNGPIVKAGDALGLSAWMRYVDEHRFTDVHEVAREDLPADCKWRD